MKIFIFHLNVKIIIFFHLILLKEYLNSDCPKKRILDNSCVSNCGSEYEFGDFCYSDCGENNLVPINSGIDKQCTCNDNKKYINVTIIDNLNFYTCLNYCPFNYYDIETNICLSKCQGKKNKIKLNSGGTGLNGCTDECLLEEVLYIKTLDNNEKNYYCLQECPDEAKFYIFIDSIFQTKQCIPNCQPDKLFYSSQTKGYQCQEDCDNQAFIDVDNGIYFCTDFSKGEKICPESFPYAFEGSCFKDCKDTNIELFGNKKTYFYLFNGKKICSQNCEENKFIVPNSLYCVDYCQKTDYKYFFHYNCLNSCEETINYPYHIYETGECVIKTCKENYYPLHEEKACYKEPPIHSEKIYLNSSNEWDTCKNPDPDNPNLIKPGEGKGYYIIKENNYSCLLSCDDFQFTEGEDPSTSIITYPYHKYNDNQCLNKSSNDLIIGNAYKYKKDKILYKSCKEMPDKAYIYMLMIINLIMK